VLGATGQNSEDDAVQVLPAGPSALLVECDDGPAAAALAAEAFRRRAAGAFTCTDIVPAARTVLLDGLEGDLSALAAQIRGWTSPPATGDSHGTDRLVAIAVRYDGPDLEQVARCWNVAPQDVIARHTGQEQRVQFCGFAPGFAYLTGLPPECAVPRLARPRTSVPAGSVGLADQYTGIYPTASPGGWQLIGTALDVVLFDPERRPPALLMPGTRVRFVAVP
jgi:KipI family sensor histidine kinase inhibitor